jgi:hypothetical protein
LSKTDSRFRLSGAFSVRKGKFVVVEPSLDCTGEKPAPTWTFLPSSKPFKNIVPAAACQLPDSTGFPQNPAVRPWSYVLGNSDLANDQRRKTDDGLCAQQNASSLSLLAPKPVFIEKGRKKSQFRHEPRRKMIG